ncbi:pilus (MSHA type) biogenesis protein MshL [Veronia pacifica]|uniref:Pilus (MSHA type) biogenesis protein MshL n=1 Tax=Veronia pacifica TaxID=1080227 RepID=A0A1C3ELQ0_9GAMM|nr:pilus (MSHA type) biogenesis protein MshL [Veronia pacifica]ODA34150.1 pilus (MSHA type) biogenesis protein MshL [Veronia pacifica]
MISKKGLTQPVLAVLVTISLSACSSVSRQMPEEIHATLDQAYQQSSAQALKNIPDAVNQDLMAFDEVDAPKTLDEKRVRVTARDVPAKAFFASLLKGSDWNLVMHPNVAGSISLSLKDVTVSEALDVVADIYGYQIEKQGKLIQVYPATMRTETFPVDYLQLKRSGRSGISVTNGIVQNSSSDNSSSDSDIAAASGTEINTTSESDFWSQLQSTISAMVGKEDGHSVTVSPQASLLTVSAYPDELREIKRYLKISEKRLKRQVVLEAKILEVTLNDGYQQGINWQNITRSIGSGGISFATSVGNEFGNAVSSALGGETTLTITDGQFKSVLSFLETQGDLNVLSSPRVTASNNQKAVIKVGGDEYFVTDISFSDAKGENAKSGPNIKLTPFFSGISLDVTPQIDENNGVLLHVHPSVVDVKTELKTIKAGDNQEFKLPLAKTSVRESDSVIHANSGDVVVIGGLMKTSVSESVSKVPLLGDIPGLGNLFRSKSKQKQKTELVILLKPSVVGDKTWQQEIKRSQQLLDQWFPDK